MARSPNPEITEGGQRKTVVTEPEIRELLEQILEQQKIMNLHLQSMTGEEFDESDLEE
jgi:hypothetical protein